MVRRLKRLVDSMVVRAYALIISLVMCFVYKGLKLDQNTLYKNAGRGLGLDTNRMVDIVRIKQMIIKEARKSKSFCFKECK